MKKISILTAGAVGYVLGARAGRERYAQIKDAASSVRRNPKVRSVVDDVKAEAASAARDAAGMAKEKVAGATRRDTSAPTASDSDVPPPGSTS